MSSSSADMLPITFCPSALRPAELIVDAGICSIFVAVPNVDAGISLFLFVAVADVNAGISLFLFVAVPDVDSICLM
jgi:hypothetical protein